MLNKFKLLMFCLLFAAASSAQARDYDAYLFITPKDLVYIPCYSNSDIEAFKDMGIVVNENEVLVAVKYPLDSEFPTTLPLSVFKNLKPEVEFESLDLSFKGKTLHLLVIVQPAYNRANASASQMLRILAQNFAAVPNFMLACEQELTTKGLIFKSKRAPTPGEITNHGGMDWILVSSTYQDEYSHGPNGFDLAAYPFLHDDSQRAALK